MPKNRPNPITSPTERARRLFQTKGGTLRARDARAAGIHSRTLAAMREAGIIERVSRGLYQLTDAPPISDPDLVLAAIKAPTAVVCLISALAHHGMTTQIPHRVDLALAPGSRTPKLDHPPIQVYRFGGKSLTEGIEEHDISGTPVRIFSLPKTIADCFTFRNKIGLDVAIEAMQMYRRERRMDYSAIMRYAEIDRVAKVMRPYLEAVL